MRTCQASVRKDGAPRTWKTQRTAFHQETLPVEQRRRARREEVLYLQRGKGELDNVPKDRRGRGTSLHSHLKAWPQSSCKLQHLSPSFTLKNLKPFILSFLQHTFSLYILNYGSTTQKRTKVVTLQHQGRAGSPHRLTQGCPVQCGSTSKAHLTPPPGSETPWSILSLLSFSCSVVSNSLQLHGP